MCICVLILGWIFEILSARSLSCLFSLPSLSISLATLHFCLPFS